MLVEAICIVLIVLIICFTFLRRTKTQYAKATIVLAIVPMAHILANIVLSATAKYLPLRLTTSLVDIVDIVALVLAEVLVFVLSKFISNKKSRMAYMLMCGGFNIILTAIFVFGK